jgi:hypothetical protein
MRMLTYFLHPAGHDLTAALLQELEKAKTLLAKRIRDSQGVVEGKEERAQDGNALKAEQGSAEKSFWPNHFKYLD